MPGYHELKSAFDTLRLQNKPVVAHASLSAFRQVQGGAGTLLGALLSSVGGLMMPTFTYKTMITPEVGPPNNGVVYGSSKDQNRLAEPFHLDMPADKLMGVVPEMLRIHPDARRTSHPILSFAGIGVEAALAAQTLYEPFAPIGQLSDKDGWVLLLGVNQTVNTSIHYAERLAGRQPFTRWALTRHGIQECVNFPGCSMGFQSLQPELKRASRMVQVGESFIQAMPIWGLVDIIIGLLQKKPLAMLCENEGCGRCAAIRQR